MAGKSWRDYSTDETVKKESSSKKTGSWKDYSTTQSAASKKSSGGWREYSEFDSTSATSNSVADKVNAWLKNHNSYLSDYQSRYSGRKYSYEDSYVNDSENWLNSVTQKMNDLETERQDILSYIDQNRDYLDAKWLDDILNTLAASRESQIQIRNAAYKDNEWWQSFGKDEDLLKKYGSAEEVYKYFQRDSGYREKYGSQTYDEFSKIIDRIGAGEEKEWLGSYASRVDYDEKSKFDMDAGTREIESLEAQREALIQELDAADASIGTANVDRAAMDLVKRIEEIEEQIQNKKAYMDSAKHIQTLNSMSSVTGNKDFADKSKYVSNVEYGLLGKPEFTDNTYAYINNPVVEDKRPLGAGEITARELIGTEKSAYSWDSPLRNRGSSYEREALEQIKPEEVSIYNYYYATQGPEKAREYLDLLVETFRERQLAETFEKTSQFANKHPILASAMSVGTSLGSGLEYLGDIIEYGGDKIAGKDAQLGRNESSLITNAIRGTVSEKVDWEIGNWDAFDFVYNTVMSGADSLASTALGGFGGTALGLSAAAQATNDALDRGMSNGQAFWNGLVSGVFEGLFESWSIGKFNALKDTPINVGLKNIDKNVIKEITKNIGKSMLVNASEETLTELANITYDTLVNGEFANYTMEDLKNGAWKQALQQVLEAGASGAFMGMGMSTVGNTSALSKGITNANEYASENYGGSTDALIQEGLESDVKSNSYKLATKYQKQTSKGKDLTGQQIRNLVSANEAQFAVENYDSAMTTAKARLTELGETKDVDKVAKLVAKRATGQELTRAEKSTLARSQFGAQIAKEMTTPTVETESGTKAYNAKYKSLEERINEDEDTNIKEIQTSDDSKAYASEAVARIENITPAAASAIMHDLDFTKPVGAQLNGIDEAYTYGYHGYSVDDLKAGNFVSNLSAEQMMSAYKLGQSARKISDTDADAPVVKMRTAAEAKLTAEQKTAQQKARIDSKDVEVYFEDGKSVVKFDEHTGKYDAKRTAAVNTAKFLSKLGIGGKYYFFESYENADGVRVYKDANGNEVEAPNGFYKDADGSIHIDLNAGDAGQGTALFTLGHELTHFVKAQSKSQFKVLGDLVAEAFDKTDLSMHERVLAKQKFLEEKRGKSVPYSEAYEEVVADAMSTMLTDGSFHEKIMEIKVKDKGLFNTIKRFFDKMIAKFKKVYEELTPDQRDARDIRQMKDMFDKIQTAFAEALVEASDNFQALAQAGIAVNEKTDSGSLESVRYVLNDADRKKTAKALAERFKVTEKEAVEWLKAETSLASLILNPKYSPFLDYEADPNEVAIKQNSDYPQGTVDFSNICKKRREFTQVMNRILRNFPNHVFAATDLAKIRTIMGEEGMTLPCGICYVEDRRQLDTIVAQDFIDGLKLYREGSKTRPDGKPFNTNQLKGLQLTDGDTYVPTIYELVSLEGRNSLKAKNPNMEAAWVRYNNARGMQAVRLLTNEAEYKRQILKYSPKTVQSKNDHGGLRIYSFSDAEMFHLIDIIQVITDSAAVGLCIQGYTKVNEYAKAVKDTGEKLNRSLIPKGDLGYHMENGKVVLDYDTVEGIDIYSEDFFDNRDNPDVGNITIGINDVQIRAAMVSDFVDQIIPFHTGQSEEVLGEKGIAAWDNYKDYQTEKDIETGRTSSHQVNIYTEVFQAAEKEGKPIRNKRQFVEKFLQVCKENGLQPRFSQFLNVDPNGDYIYTEGYHKLLVDFKTFAQTEVGEYLPQMPVKPFFDNGYITGLLETYVKEQQVKDAEVAEQMPKVIERITNEIVKPMQDGVKNSDRSAKTFKKDQNANGVFVANSLIDLAETDSKWWTGRYNHDILSMSKSDDTEFRQFYQEIEKRTKDMEDNGEQKQTADDSFTVQDGKGKEYIYHVELDGYMHGVVLEKIDKAKYEAALQRETKGGTNGKSLADIKRRTGTNRAEMGRYRAGDGWNRASDGNSGHGRLGGRSPKSDMAGNDGRENQVNQAVPAVTATNQVKRSDRSLPSMDAYEGKTPTKRELWDDISKISLSIHSEELDLRGAERNGSVGRIKSIRSRLADIQERYIEYGEYLLQNYDKYSLADIKSLSKALRLYKGFSEGETYTIERFKADLTAKISAYRKDIAEVTHEEVKKMPLTEENAGEETTVPKTKEHLVLKLRELHQEIGNRNYSMNNTAQYVTGVDKLWGQLERREITVQQYEEQLSNRSPYYRELLEQNRTLEKEFDKLVKELETLEDKPWKQLRRDVLYRYSERGEGASNRDLLANAFEGITKSSIEYKLIQQYKSHIAELNELEAKLSDLNAEIRKIRFGTEGAKDTARLTELESEAKEVAKEINKQDKRLLSLEASEPLRKVIERERKKEAQKTKAHVEEIQQNKKVRAEQAELRHKIRKTIRDLDKILKHGNKQKNVKEDLQPVVTKALKAADILFTENYGTYDMLRNGIGADLSDAEQALVNTCTKMLKDLDKMPTDGYENWQARQEAENRLNTKMSKLKDVFARERKRLNNTTVSSILGELADAYASLEKSEQSYVQGAYTEAVHNFLKNLQSEVGGSIVKDMTKDQLESVYAAYKMVLTAVRKANQMFNEELKQSREQLGNAVIQEVRNAGGVHGLWTKAELAASRADWNNMKPVWVANRIGSETFGKLMNGLFKGQYNFAVDIDEAKRFKLEMDKKYHPRNWDAEKQYKFESSTGKEFSLSLQQIMSVYAFSKREQAYSHLLNGGFVFESNSTVVVDKKGIKRTYLHDGATSYKLNEATLNEIINSLTKEQKAYVDEMQKYLSEVMGEKGNEVSMQLYGIKMFKEQFYFPLRSSGAYMERAKEAEMKKQQGQINLVNSGFTHAVKPEAKNPIILSGFLDVWAEHCNEMSMYHSMVLPMEDFRKVYNYSTVHDNKVDSASVFQTIQDAYGDAATAYIDQLYRELNAGATIDPRETTFKKLISNFKKTAVMMSASVVVQQFSSIGRAYALIDPKYFIGTKVNSDTKLSVVDEMKKYAPVAIIKEMGGFDTGTKGSAKSYIMAEQYSNGERIQGLLKDDQYRSDIMGYLPAKADEKTWCAIWEAVKRETKATHPKMDVKSEEFLKLAGDRFSEIIEKTQVYDSVLARSANMRSKTGLMQMATSFMAEPTTTVNLLEDAIRSGNKKHMERAFGATAVSIVLNNALASVVYAMRDDDEDETFIEKYFQSFTSGMIDDINPMSYYPFLKDVYSLFQGYDVERADMSVIADLRDALKRVVSLMGKDTSSMDDNELAAHHKQVNEVFMSLLDAGCSVFGVPLKNVRRDANGIINAFTTIGKDLSSERNTTWLSFWDKVGAAAKDTIPGLAWTKDKAKTDKLYEAIISGDKSYLARLKSTYKTDSAYQSAVRKALRENDSRIHEAAQAKYDGKAEEYKRIFKEIQKEGKFSFDDIMSAINSEESKIRNGLEPDKATSSYTASDFVEAVAIGNASEAKAMMEEIISTKVANGKTQEEAEKEFASNVSTGIRDAYSAGLLDEAGAKNMLVDYAGKDEEEASSKVSYWDFSNAHPEYELSESNVTDYQEFAEPAGIDLDVFVKYINGTKNLATKYDEWGDVEVTKREQVLEVIDSLPLTWQQKDALYLAAGYSESNIWDVPW